MSGYQCPNGHTSATADFCDTCGEPIAGVGTAAAPAAAAAAAPASVLDLGAPAGGAVQVCANCKADNASDALFCEVCGADFATGQLPAPVAPVETPEPAVVITTPPTPSTVGADWVAEVWIDPDWFDTQDAAGVCATAGAPTVVPLPSTGALIGRGSKSRNIVAEVDCSADSSVSGRHATLTLDHDRWFIEDAGSTNGTFIGSTGEALPTVPLAQGVRHELADDDRVYVGAWTRIMVRRATADEKAATI